MEDDRMYTLQGIWPTSDEGVDEDSGPLFEGFPDRGDGTDDTFLFNSSDELDPRGATLWDYLHRIGLKADTIVELNETLRYHQATIKAEVYRNARVEASRLKLTTVEVCVEPLVTVVVADLWLGSDKICQLEFDFHPLRGISIF